MKEKDKPMIQKLIRIINDMKLQTKLFLSFIIVVFVPVMIVGILLTQELRSMALNNASEQIAINVERVKQRTNEIINVANDSAYRLANDQRLERAATHQYEKLYDVVKAYREYTEFHDTLILYKEVSNIRLYVNNPTLLNNWEFIQPGIDIMSSYWYREALESNGLSGWYYIEDERDGRNYLSLVRKVFFTGSSFASNGVLVINVNMRMLNDILNQESFETMLVDSNNQIVAANRGERIGKMLEDIAFDPDIISEQEGVFATEVDGQASQIRIEPLLPVSSFNSLRIVSIFSVDQIVQGADRINRLALSIIAASLIIAFFLIYGFSKLLSKRMLRLSKHISKVGAGNLETSVQIDGKDEIGQLSRQFNSMVASINELIAEVQESNNQRRLLESRQSQIKFKMMASQINPHFLFNTLESIRMKAHLKGQKDISQVVRLLGKMMRKNLEVSQRNTTLKDEIDLVQCYLDIQKFRYEDRLHYDIRIDPQTESTPLPPLIVQPLVENAVIHGLENKENGGTVRVQAELDGKHVRIEVTDDGIGMSADKIKELYETINDNDEEEQNRIGLRNVHQRLLLSYGSDYGLHIESEPGTGTRIHFLIPM